MDHSPHKPGRIGAHLRTNVIGYLALFFALSMGTAYATHPGGANTVSSVDIINEEVRNDDLAPNAVGSGKIADRQVKNADLSIGASSSNTIADGGVQGVDVKNDTLTGTQVDEGTLFNDNSLTGADVNESTLGKVPSAATADDADALGGQKPSEFAPANPAATIDVPDEQDKLLLRVPGVGDLIVQDCEATDSPVHMNYGWDNTTSTDQDVWHDAFDVDDTPPPFYALLTPTGTETFNFSGPGSTDTIVDTIRIRPVTSSTSGVSAVTIHFFARVDENGCRASAQAVLSG